MYVCVFVAVNVRALVSVPYDYRSTLRFGHEITAATHSLSGQWVWTGVWSVIVTKGRVWKYVNLE